MLKKVLISVGVLLVLGAGVLGYFYFKPQDKVGYRENTGESAVLTNATTTANGSVVSVVYYRNVGLTLAADNSSGTLKFACSYQDVVPNFGATATSSNAWDYVDVIDMEDGASIDGDTGITLAGTTEVRQFEINSNGFRWCTALLSGSVSGTTNVRIKPSDNQ